MAEEQREIPCVDYLSLGSSAQKAICLFGKTIFPVESSSLESEATAMLHADVPIPSEKEIDEDLKTLSSFEVELEDSVSLGLSIGISGSPNINSKVTCAGIEKDLTEDARKFKKMRYLPNEEREKRVRERTPYPWTIKKTLTQSDINKLTRLMLETRPAEDHIMRYLSADDQKKIQKGIRVKVSAYDEDTRTPHHLVVKRHVTSSKSYVLNGDWAQDFVKRRKLQLGDTIGLFWDQIDSTLHFSVLQRSK
ncbi:hypothetical protein CARUB_v10021689mg [Capsella rubella]|uniref:TF-B3 domain-containing protein n=1 Tax=Capsella rubella TaxID=81985 RepID=R0GC47_9BRAS|nr:putative B3 domain-containing protein At1g78640 [Capsella rubella]EOA33312.1 hypothetical protein CARUB_v10021689mg [Capsella rubella]